MATTTRKNVTCQQGSATTAAVVSTEDTLQSRTIHRDVPSATWHKSHVNLLRGNTQIINYDWGGYGYTKLAEYNREHCRIVDWRHINTV